ncbi:S4 domain protein [Mycobacterium kansasii]|uniref:S4 domain protein n=1 Tax=Mycobacterium kansasii TaxID=1768 RepID=A0A1V3WHK0_MYCKA|nr:S4 domain protein [Mycobacterium kansasii]
MPDRSMPVPEGLAGLRVDAGLARLLGLSRSAVAAIAEGGGVQLDGVPAGKSDRLTSGHGCRFGCPRHRHRWKTHPSTSKA